MRIFLVNSGNDDGIADITNQYAYPPLSIISLGTALQNAFAERVEICLYDGQVDTTETIIREIRAQRPDVVGVSMYLTSVRNAVSIIQEGKGVGAVTILGNDHSMFHADSLMRRVPELDFVCTNDVGEETIVPFIDALLRKTSVLEAPLLKYRSGDAIMETVTKSAIRQGETLDAIAIPNRTLLREEYWSEYSRRFHRQNRKVRRFFGDERVSTINRARGCAQRKTPCRYCGIADLSFRYSSADVFWADVRAAKDQVGATVLYEAFDSASSAGAVLKRWRDRRPADLENTYFKMYAQAFESSPDRVALFKDLNVFCINMGLDSGDDRALKLLKGPKHSLSQNKAACQLYSDNQIEIYTSFVLFGLGSDSETAKSLEKTLEFADWLVANTSTVSFDAAMMYPDKSAPIGRLIWYPEEAAQICERTGWTFLNIDELERVSKKWQGEIYIDANELCADFAKICGTSSTLLMDYWTELQKISDRAGMNFGGTDG